MADVPAQVFLVGAGPGDPGLLTVRGLECLSKADLIIHDQLVPLRLLDYAPASAERLCVADLPGCHPERWPHIHRAMIDAARRGKRVVRLKGGDPFVFGRGGEEALALREAGIPYEIVPGVTAALAASACAAIPLTHRLHASAVALVTGHEDAARPEGRIDWPALARFPGTLVLYMAIARLAKSVEALLAAGIDPATPTAVVRWAATSAQQTLEVPLVELPARVAREGIKAPAVVLIGSVVRLRTQLAWFERRPLFGRHVLITRPRRQAEPLVRRLEELGAQALCVPMLEIREPADWLAADGALAALSSYDWLVFTSVNGVHAVIERLRHLGWDLRALGPLRLAVIGPGTADALRSYHLEPDLMPAEYRSEALAAELKVRAVGQRILLARADRGREVLREELAGVATVQQVTVYAQYDAIPDATTLALLDNGDIDYVTLTSSNIAHAFLGAIRPAAQKQIQAGTIRLVAISSVTSAVVHAAGYPVAAEALEYTTDGVVAALLRLAGDEGTDAQGRSRSASKAR
jgi:uroporphyrinogen III methyltransferase/synthase